MKEKELMYIFMILMLVIVAITGLLLTNMLPQAVETPKEQTTFYVWEDRCEEVKQVPVVVEINLPTPTRS